MTLSYYNNGLETLLCAQGQPDQPQSLFVEVRDYCRARFGFRLMTVMRYYPDTGDFQRMYSTLPEHFPLGGRKPMGRTAWGEYVLKRGNAWLGNSAKEIQDTFPDAENILLHAGEACACLPVRWNGQTLAVLSLCDQRNSYTASDMAILTNVSQLILPALLDSGR